MNPWEIWLSESQERMVLAVPPKSWPVLKALCDAEDVEAFELGTFKDTGRLQVFFKGERVADLTMSFLHDGLPRAMQRAEWSAPKPPPGRSGRRGSLPLHWPEAGRRLRDMLAHPNTCSRAWMIRQYDHEVQGQTVQKPLQGPNHGPGDASVVWPITATGEKVIPAIALSHGLSVGNPDPYVGAVEAIDEAMRNLACAGADTRKAAMLDNFCWGDVRNPNELGSLTRCAMGCHDAAVAYGVPFISGKDSLHNTYVDLDGKRHSIPGTLLISALAPMEVDRRLTMDLKGADHTLFLIQPKKPGLASSRAVLDGLYAAHEAGLLLSAHDVSEGGMAVAAAEMAFAGGIGLKLTTGTEDEDDELPFFEEGLTRFLVELEAGKEKKLQAIFKEQVCWQVGTTVKDTFLRVQDKTGRVLMEETLDALRGAWNATLPRVLDAGEPVKATPPRASVAAVLPREMTA
jgi:phosphoribosylformylglycinamidine synthase